MPDGLTQSLALPGLGWLVVAICFAGLVRGFTGFGSAMIIMPVASSVLSPVDAIVFLTTVELLGPLLVLPRAVRDANLGDVTRLGAGAVLAIPVGVYSLSHMTSEFFGWIISAIVLLLLLALMSGWRYDRPLTPSLITATGALGGFLSGATGMPGPPVIMLYMASGRVISVIRANIMLYLFLIDLMMLVVVALFGLLVPPPIVVGLVLALPYVVFTRIGAALFRPGSERLFRAVTYAIIAVSALLGLPLWK